MEAIKQIIGLTGEAQSLIQKRQEAIAALGSKWIHHPTNHVKKRNIKPNSLGFKTV